MIRKRQGLVPLETTMSYKRKCRKKAVCFMQNMFLKKTSFLTGFTLLELLLAISLFSIIIIGVYSSLTVGIKAHERGKVLGGEYSDLGLLFQFMEKDLRSAIAMNNIYLVQESQRLYFYASEPETDGGRGLFKITYYWNKEDGVLVLYRLKQNYIDSLQNSDVKGEEIFDSISQIGFQYGYWKGEDEEELEFVWKSGWEEEGLPKMVLLSLMVDESVFEKYIYCPAGSIAKLEEEL